jgi:hypothetical protein
VKYASRVKGKFYFTFERKRENFTFAKQIFHIAGGDISLKKPFINGCSLKHPKSPTPPNLPLARVKS